MNTASEILKKVDLLDFITQSGNRGTALRLNRANVISFPSCGNWINKPVDPATLGNEASSLFRSLLAR